MIWERLEQLGRTRSFDQLNSLFAGGAAPRGLDGTTEGILVAPDMGRVRTPLVRVMSRFYMPWLTS